MNNEQLAGLALMRMTVDRFIKESDEILDTICTQGCKTACNACFAIYDERQAKKEGRH